MYLLNPVKHTHPKLHASTVEILFNHKSEIFRNFNDIKGLYFLDHISLILINPGNEMVIFSSTPSVEFNLIMQGLWEFDLSFNPHHHTEGKILFWEDAYLKTHFKEIKSIKETQHNFSLGFNLTRKIDDFNFIYSFATRHCGDHLPHYYQNLIHELTCLGDFGYKLLRNIYTQYCGNHEPPLIEQKKRCSHLKLIVNN